jgi:hypothetical protein
MIEGLRYQTSRPSLAGALSLRVNHGKVCNCRLFHRPSIAQLLAAQRDNARKMVIEVHSNVLTDRSVHLFGKVPNLRVFFTWKVDHAVQFIWRNNATRGGEHLIIV